MITKPIKVVQFRLSGRTEGLRLLRQCTGLHRWRLHIYLQHADGWLDERDVLVSAPCPVRALTAIYEQQINELCAPVDGQTPTVRGGGFDGWLLPPRAAPSKPDRNQYTGRFRPHETPPRAA